MWISLALVLALGAPAKAPANGSQEPLAVAAGASDTGCCSYRKAAGEAWHCVELTKTACENAVKTHNIPKNQWHFSKGNNCADNKDCPAPKPAPIAR